MNTLSNFLTIGLLSIGVQAYSATTLSQYSPDSTRYQSRWVDEYRADCRQRLDKNALVIYLPSEHRSYALTSQGSPYLLKTPAREQLSGCFNKVVALDTKTGKLTPFFGESTSDNYSPRPLRIGTESRAVEEIEIYAKSLQRLANAIKAADPQSQLNLWSWQVPYSELSKQLLAWLAELEPKAVVVLTTGSHRGLSYLDELDLSRSTNWDDRYSVQINNQIFADNKPAPLTRLFGQRPLSFAVQWRDENLFKINTRLEDTEQLSLPLWFLPDSPLKSEISLTVQPTPAITAPLQLLQLTSQAGQLTFNVRQNAVKPTVRYPDNKTVDWTSRCPIEKESAQTWINYLVNGAQLVCPYFDDQNKVQIELIGDGIVIDTRQLLLSIDIRLDDEYTSSTDWQLADSLSHLPSNNQRGWKILTSDLSFGQCSLTLEPISTEATLAFTSTRVNLSDELCQRLYKPDNLQRGLKPWPNGQLEKMDRSLDMTVKPALHPLQTHLPKDSLWREMHWQLNQQQNCQINEEGYFDCGGGNQLHFIDLLGGQISLQGFNETIHIDQRLANNQALLAIYCGDWPRLFPLSHRNIIKGTADNPYTVLDRNTNITRYFKRIYDEESLWSLTALPVKADDIEGFDKWRDQLFSHGIPISPRQQRLPICNNYAYYQLATAEKAAESDFLPVSNCQSDQSHINWVFVNTQGEWRGIWDYYGRRLAKPLADFLRSIEQEMIFHLWFLDVNNAHQITLEEYSRTTVNSQTDERKISNRLIQPIQNMRSPNRYADFSQQVPQALSTLAEQQQWQQGGRYWTILFAHRLSIADLERQINRISLQTPKQSLVILSPRLPKDSQRTAWAKQGIRFIRLTPSSDWYDELAGLLKAWNTGQ